MNTLVHQQMDGSAAPWIQIQTKRVSTGTILAGIIGNITVTWDASFPDGNYTISAMVETGALSILQIDSIVSKGTTTCVIAVKNVSLLSNSGTIHVTAIHD